jgi:hypothetical protein
MRALFKKLDLFTIYIWTIIFYFTCAHGHMSTVSTILFSIYHIYQRWPYFFVYGPNFIKILYCGPQKNLRRDASKIWHSDRRKSFDGHTLATPAVNFINIKRMCFCTNIISAAFSSYMYIVKAAVTYFCMKNLYVKRWWNWLLVYTHV